MIRKFIISFWKRVLIVFLIVSIGTFSIYMTSYAAEDGNERKIIVSLGDSYSSGEGIEPFYGQDEDVSKMVANPDWLAHRSEKAWPGMLTLPSVNGKMSEYDNKDKHWFFAAASGATTQNIRYNFIKEYDKSGIKGSYSLEPQLKVFDKLGKNKADYVTLTLGGNDVDFEGTITQSVTKSSYLEPNHMTDKINSTWKSFFAEGGVRDKLYDAYLDIANRAGSQAQIIVAGYPQLLDTTGHSIIADSKLLGGLLKGKEVFSFSEREAIELNSAVSKFNRAIESIVNDCKGNKINKICFVSVEEEFKGHEAYSGNSYINPVIFNLSETQDLKDFDKKDIMNTLVSSYSIHPNEKGAEAYARCVQAKINEFENIQSTGTYNTKFTLTVYDADDYIYDNYTIKIDGKEFVDTLKRGLFKKDYTKTISVEEAKKIKINIPKGDYSVTVIDGTDENHFYKKDIKVRSNAKKDELIYWTDFGQSSAQKDDDSIFPENLPTDAVEYNGHYYYLYTGGIASDYEKAVQYCNSKGGYLATLTSQEENDFVYSYISKQGCKKAYIGLSRAVGEGDWEWCTGETLDYTNWHSGKPGSKNSNKDYALLYYKYSDGSWNNGDFSGHTVSGGSAFICEWGDYSTEQNQVLEGDTVSDERNIVLTLDISGSMSGTPMEETKKASANFINTVLEQDAGIGIVTYDDMSNIASGFSADRAALQSIVSELDDGGGTNIEAGLRDAQWMLEKTRSKKKIIVLMSDGEPNDGLLGEDLIAYANEIKKTGTIIYTIGFFESLSEKSYSQYLMESIASDGCHYEVANADELAFFFGDMADQINGQKYIYVRIACPVDVSVTFDGETLDSSEGNLNSRTSFGTLTFEENREEVKSGADDRVKVLRLKEGVDYDLELTGTGYGVMNYTIGFMDENGDYSDQRKFENIKITRRTRIDTVAANSDYSTLNIDEDGDGKYDIRLRAEANGYGEEVAVSDMIIYVIIATVIFIMLDIVAIVIYTKRKKRKGE